MCYVLLLYYTCLMNGKFPNFVGYVGKLKDVFDVSVLDAFRDVYVFG